MEQQRVQDIVLLARNGSQEAYKELIERFGSSLLGYFYRNTGELDDAEDLVQDVFMRVVKGLKRYNEQEKFAIVGDVLFNNSIGRTDLPGGDFNTLISGIKTKLFKLPDNMTVYPGHGIATTIGKEKKTNPFLK